MNVGDWVTVRKVDFPPYGVIIRRWRGKFVVSWGWRMGGNFHGIASKEQLMTIPSPSLVVNKGVELIKENLKKFRWRFSKHYAYDAASMELFRYIIESINHEDG